MLVTNIFEKAYVSAKKDNIDIVLNIILKEFRGCLYYIYNEIAKFNIMHQP